MRILIVAPHVDDEMFGMGGTLLWHKACGDEIRFLWFTQARNTSDYCKHVAKYFNAQHEFLDFKDQELDTYPIKALIESVEIRVQSFQPDIVYTSFDSDLNMDHRLVSEAVKVTCRPYKFDKAPIVYMFRIPGTTELGLRPFINCRDQKINKDLKVELIKKWYPDEIKNGREAILEQTVESFERWPRLSSPRS